MLVRSPKELAAAAISQRKALGLTQSEVADRVGLKQKTISAFENHPESVKLVTAFLVLSALHLDMNTQTKGGPDNKKTPWDEEW